MSNSVLRILTALVGIPAVVGLLYVGSWPFALLVLLLALLAQYELYGLLEAAGFAPRKVLGLALGALLVAAALYGAALHVAAGAFVLLLAIYPFLGSGAAGSQPNRGSSEAPKSSTPAALTIGTLPATIFGAIYPSALLGYLIALRAGRGPALDDGDAFLLTLTVFIVVWTTDTAAYYVGRSMGKRPLAPKVSPKKTWEGTIGGAVGAILVAILLKVVLLDFLPWMHAIVIGAICATFGQLGDLAESRLKRLAGVKDSGGLLPGHGGMLDRFDAMILAAPAVYVYLLFATDLFDRLG